MLKETELLIPAGSLDVLKTAVNYGANAVYIGGEAFGLRANAKNFSIDEIREGVAYAHERNVKVFVTANILAHNGDMDEAREYFKELSTTGIDAVLVADPGMFMIAKETLPESVELHISTQANNTNYETFLFWWKMGAKRVVCARELSLKEIKEIREHIPVELDIEAFIHGAMCMSYSGRCMLSNFFTGRDANRGECTHPCRWKYNIVEEKRPGQYYPIYENDRGTFIFNSKDLCMIEHVPELIEAGIDSLKIEGRMKTALYVATVARTYRKALDDLKESEEKYRANMEWYKSEIAKCTYREFTTGFYYGKPSQEDHIYDNNTYVTGSVYLGTIERTEDGWSYLEQKNKFSVGETIEIMKPNGDDIPIEVLEIRDAETDVPQESCPHACQKIKVRFSVAPEARDIIRKETPDKQDVD
ncbi:peptidase U32 family protein [Oribacterium sp. WCC10]|uniref:peptidase U32 family protein n=1 Tax=Oribacterium sp. WCC10 TaxID=1855343 RepID=UPI0008F15AE6|nr:U32 family peptidase [Oribacterium sp. WCC10]SFG38768.1 putative protease [Oribacterium sp. WCC10]